MTCCGYDTKCICDTDKCTQPANCDLSWQKETTQSTVCCDKQPVCECDDSKCQVDDQVLVCSAIGHQIVTTDEVYYAASKECCSDIYKKECQCKTDTCPSLDNHPLSEKTCGDYRCQVIKNDGCCDYTACACPTDDGVSCVVDSVKKCRKDDSLLKNADECPDMCMKTKVKLPEDAQCCDSYRKCQCKDQKPSDLKQCDPECEDAITTTMDGICGTECGYQVVTCKPKPYCLIDGVRVAPGETKNKKIDPCTTCSCPSTPDENGLYKTICTTKCCTDCPFGHSRIPQKGKCCGECVPLTCTDAQGKSQKVGDQWKPVDDQCITCMCKQGDKDIYAECFSTRKEIVGECPEEFIERSADGCIEICNKPDDSIAGCGLSLDYESHVELVIAGEECKSEGVHRMTMCTGGCNSESIVKGNKPEKACQCCSATATEATKIQFICNGIRKEHIVEIPTACACNSSQCGVTSAEEDLMNQIGDAMSLINDDEDESLLDKIDDKIDDVVDKVEDTVKKVGSKIGNFFGGLFGQIFQKIEQKII